MQKAPNDVLVQKTAQAAVAGMRPHEIEQIEDPNNTLEPDIVPDSLFTHEEDLGASFRSVLPFPAGVVLYVSPPSTRLVRSSHPYRTHRRDMSYQSRQGGER